MAPPSFLAEGGVSPPRIETHGLPDSFWLLFKVSESGSHGKNDKVNWDHQGTESHICHTVQENPEKVCSEQGFQFEFTKFELKGLNTPLVVQDFPPAEWRSQAWDLFSQQHLKKEKDAAKGLLAYRQTTPVPSRQAANGKAEQKKSTKTFHTQLDPRWLDLQSLWAKETIK